MEKCIQWDRITKLETTLDLTNKNVMDKIDSIEDKIDWIENKIDAFHAKFDTFAEKLEGKYASKWVEVAIKWAVWIIVGIVLTAMVYQVIVK